MAGEMKPWERYAAPAQKPWERYAGAENQAEAEDQKPKPRGFLQEAGRQLGLTGRAVLEGAASLPGMVANVPAAASNLLFGTHIPDQTTGVPRALDALGFPQPENSTERVVGGIAGALSGTGAVAKAAGLAEKPLNAVANYIPQALQANMGTQGLAAAGGATGAGVARENGAGPGVQLAAGLAGGVLAPAAVGAAGAAVRGAKALAWDPFRTAGQRQSVGQRMNMAAGSTRQQAIENLRNAEEIIPGSVPTTGEASGNLGLIGLQKTVTERSKGLGEGMPFGDRAQAQNAARLRAIHEVAGDQEQLAGMIQGRNARTAPMREGALSRTDPRPQAVQPPDPDPVFEWSMFPARVQRSADVQVNTAPALAQIDEILASPIGARTVVQRAMNQARTAIQGETNARRLYEVGKDINKTILTQLQKEGADVSVARGAMGQVRRSLYDSIDDVAPGFNGYLRRYARDSEPIDQMRTTQRITDDVYLAPTDTTGQPIVSQAKWARQVKRVLPRLQADGDLSEDQISQLVRIGDDLDRGALLTNPNVKSAGSDTLRNLTGANVVGALAGGNVDELGAISATVMRPLKFLYLIPNRQMERLMQEAMLDTRLAAQLMSEATPKSTFNLAALLRSKAQSIGITIPRVDTKEKEP